MFGNHKGHKGHKEAALGRGPCVRKGARPARGPGGAWRASHAMLWGKSADAPTARHGAFRRCRRFRRCRNAADAAFHDGLSVARLPRAPFSVLRSPGRVSAPPPAGGGGGAPHPNKKEKVWGSAPHLSNQLISQILCVPLWSFVFLAVEGLALWACTVIAAQREACPNLQASKLPSFHANRLRGKTSPESRQSGRGGDLLCYSLWIGLLRTRILGMRRCG